MRITHDLLVCGPDQTIDFISAITWAALVCLLFPLAKAECHVGITAHWCSVLTACDAWRFAAESSRGVASCGAHAHNLRRNTDAWRSVACQASCQRAAAATSTVATCKAFL